MSNVINGNSIYGIKTIRFGAEDERTVVRDSGARFVDYVQWGDDNLFPQRFLKNLTESSFYYRISSSQVNMLVGDGLRYEGKDKLYAENYLSALGVDLTFLNRAAWDVVVLNAFSAQVILNLDQTKPAKIYHCRADKVRVDKNLNDFDEVTAYWLAKDWSVINNRGKVIGGTIPVDDRPEYAPFMVPKWSPSNREALSLIYNIEYNPAMQFYPVPSAEPSFREIELNNQIIEFQQSSLENGIAGSVVIKYPKKQLGDPAEEAEEQRKIAESIKESLSNAQNAGKATVVFYDPQSEAIPELEAFPSNDNDKKYIETNRIIRESIFSGLGVISEELFGIPSAGGFSSQSELLKTANELTYFNVIRPKQSLILEPLNLILSAAGIDAVVDFINAKPIDDRLTLEMVAAGVISKDEFREALGLAPLNQISTNGIK